MTRSRVLSATSSAIVIFLLLGTGSAQKCTVSLSSVVSGAAQCFGDTYMGTAANKDVQAMVAAAVAEYGLPSATAGPMTYLAAAAFVQPRVAEALGLVQGGLGCIFSNSTVNQTADEVWAQVKMFFQAHCAYVAPVISACMRNVSQPKTCGSSTSYITNATSDLLGMYCNTTTWQFKESLSAGLAGEIKEGIRGMCATKVPSAVSSPIFSDLTNLVGLIGGIASGGDFAGDQIVRLLSASAVNGTLSWLDLRSLPALARNFTLVCKTQLPYALSQAFDLPSGSPLLAAADTLCDGLAARIRNVSTPAQLVLAVAALANDAVTSVSNAASSVQALQALSLVALGPAATAGITVTANMSYQAFVAVSAAIANVTGARQSNGSFDPSAAVVNYVLVGAAFDSSGLTCGMLTRFSRLVGAVRAKLTPLSQSGNFAAAELLSMINGSAVAQALLAAGAQQPGCSPAVVAGLLRQLTGDVLVPANCVSITGYDSIVSCLLASSANASVTGGAVPEALVLLRNAFVYAALTGLQNTTRAAADLARITGLSVFFNNTMPRLNNITDVAAKASQLAMAVGEQFVAAFTVPQAKLAASPSLSSSPSDIVDFALASACNVTRQVTAAVDVAVAQQVTAGNYLARDVMALGQTPMVQTVRSTVQNATQQVCDCTQTAVAVHRAVMAFVAQQRLPANDTMRIINFTCNATTPYALYAVVRRALTSLPGNPCAAAALAEINSSTFQLALGYVVNATRMACDSYKLEVALENVFNMATMPFDIYSDPYGFLNFFLDQAAWDKFMSAYLSTVQRLARAGNLAADQWLQWYSTNEFRIVYGYFDNVTTTVRSFVRLFNSTCLRPDTMDVLLSTMLDGNYALTNDALDAMSCGIVDVGRCALRALNKVTGGGVDQMQNQIAFGSAYAAGLTGLPLLDMGPLVNGYNEPTNDYSPKASKTVVTFFGGGWTQSVASPTAEMCYNIENVTVLITNQNYTLFRSYNPQTNTESVSLTFYAFDKTGAQKSVASYSVTSGPKGAAATAPIKFLDATRKPVTAAKGSGFNVALTVNATSKAVKITESVSQAAFTFFVNPTTRNIAAVVRGTSAAIQTSIGRLVCGCMNKNPTANLLGAPRAICFAKCPVKGQKVCSVAECRAVTQYQASALDVIDYIKKTT